MNKIANYIKQSQIELAKVIFPTKQQIRVAFYAVIAVVTVVTLYLAFVDWVMSSSLKAIIG